MSSVGLEWEKEIPQCSECGREMWDGRATCASTLESEDTGEGENCGSRDSCAQNVLGMVCWEPAKRDRCRQRGQVSDLRSQLSSLSQFIRREKVEERTLLPRNGYRSSERDWDSGLSRAGPAQCHCSLVISCKTFTGSNRKLRLDSLAHPWDISGSISTCLRR